ncbi:MAG: hypothetical protein J6J15_04175 [Oscillospiraceae bacterium]|nr:hypothetical protein [Oscillospiraceae bacterium]
MDEEKRQEYIEKLVDNLPMLRKKLGLTQQGLANIIGVSSYTILAIEKKQRKMTWSTFLSVLIVCLTKEDVRQILTALNIYTDELIEFIEGKR